MTRVFTLLTVAASATLAAACASAGGSHQEAKNEAATVLGRAPSEPYPVIYAAARDSSAWGDRWTAGNLFERSLDKAAPSNDKLTVQSRFNVAARYERTGRLAEADALYRSVARDGQFLWGITDPDYRNPTARLTTINVGDEAMRRAIVVERRMAFARGTGAPSATGAGTPTAAIVGGPALRAGRISDAEARRLDDQAEAAGR
jgi:hypothetical protein